MFASHFPYQSFGTQSTRDEQGCLDALAWIGAIRLSDVYPARVALAYRAGVQWAVEQASHLGMQRRSLQREGRKYELLVDSVRSAERRLRLAGEHYEDVMEWDIGELLLSSRTEQALQRVRLAHGRRLTLYELRDQWQEIRLRSVCGVSNWTLVSLGRSLMLLGLEHEFSDIVEATRRYESNEELEGKGRRCDVLVTNVRGKAMFEFAW